MTRFRSFYFELPDNEEWPTIKPEKQIMFLNQSSDILRTTNLPTSSIYKKLVKFIKTPATGYQSNLIKEVLDVYFVANSSVLLESYFEKVGLFDPDRKSASDFYV